MKKTYMPSSKDCKKPEVDLTSYCKEEKGSFVIRQDGRPVARVEFTNNVNRSYGGAMPSENPSITIICMDPENNEVFRIGGRGTEGNKKRLRYVLSCLDETDIPEELVDVQRELKKHI